MQEVIVNLGVGVNWPGGGNMQVFLGNPGDYAWGREGLDAIVTQLLNQMDGTGNLALLCGITRHAVIYSCIFQGRPH